MEGVTLHKSKASPMEMRDRRRQDVDAHSMKGRGWEEKPKGLHIHYPLFSL